MSYKSASGKEDGLPSLHRPRIQRSKLWMPLRVVGKFAILAACTYAALRSLGVLEFPEAPFREKDFKNIGELCPQPPPLVPSANANLWQELAETRRTDEFVGRAVKWLGGAVRVPTQSYDSMGPIGEDPRWEAFGPFHEYLARAFPKIHKTLLLTKVNIHGLVYEWTGSDASLKPLLLAAHQDVVPVNPDTISEWKYPPFSGYYDGKFLWGRGSSDDKSGLIGILTTIEVLLEKGFEPTRSVVLAFGFDEEASGLYGARTIGKYLLEAYGKNAFAMLVDEGGDTMYEYGKVFATVGTAEKGYLDVRVQLESPGGHSSVPPLHTSIGILSSLLVHIENNPAIPHLNRGSPMYEKALCLGAYAPDLPAVLRGALRKAPASNKALHTAEEILFQDRLFKALVQTTQAIDLIQGGVKTNALPESAWAVVNHRIAADSSVEEVQERDAALLFDLAHQFNLSYTAFGKQLTAEGIPSAGKLTMSEAWGAALAPAPLTPTGATAFQLLAGSVKATFNTHRGLEGNDNIVVSPGHMSGNTDTRHYWDLTPHIFRYNQHFSGNTSIFKDIHTVNEFIEVDAYIEMIGFFTTLILNADESTTL